VAYRKKAMESLLSKVHAHLLFVTRLRLHRKPKRALNTIRSRSIK
jgi:hypothetical protein